VLPLLAAHRAEARAVLPDEVFAYVDGGSGDEVTRDEAAAAWGALRFRPRALRDVSSVDSGTSLFGVDLAAPVLVAPTASHGLVHADGEVATALGAATAGSALILSTRATRPIADVAAAADGRWWFQVYVMRDRRATHDLVRRAADAGARALVLTGDTPVLGRRPRAGRLEPLAAHLEQDPAATAADIGWLADVSGLPVLVKGVLRGDDAARCVDAGAAGIVVSNHGGRQLDRAVATALALPDVVAAVGSQVPVLVDGGIDDGGDILAALALGAAAVLVGRPVLWALAAGGADGVRTTVVALGDDLRQVMALAGVARLDDVDASLLYAG
jgi:4-hydroxymandelate oxidase